MERHAADKLPSLGGELEKENLISEDDICSNVGMASDKDEKGDGNGAAGKRLSHQSQGSPIVY